MFLPEIAISCWSMMQHLNGYCDIISMDTNDSSNNIVPITLINNSYLLLIWIWKLLHYDQNKKVKIQVPWHRFSSYINFTKLDLCNMKILIYIIVKTKNVQNTLFSVTDTSSVKYQNKYKMCETVYPGRVSITCNIS